MKVINDLRGYKQTFALVLGPRKDRQKDKGKNHQKR